MRKDWALISIIGLILVIGLGLIGYLKIGKKQVIANPLPSSSQEVAGAATNAPYFSEDAKVMYFYTDSCHWCIKEKNEVLTPLGQEGYKVKPMNVGENQDLAKKYNITGTPTFMVEGGERVEGFQTKEQLKALLDKYK